MYRTQKVNKFLVLISILAGVWLAYLIGSFYRFKPGLLVVVGVLFSLMFGLIAGRIWRVTRQKWEIFNSFLENTAVEVLLGSIAGLFLGLVIGFLVGYPFSTIHGVGIYISLGSFFTCGYLGLKIGRKRGADIIELLPRGYWALDKQTEEKNNDTDIKVLDTSAIIDGRIYDVCLANFLDGRLLVPSFVLEELRHIADSSDYVRRSKGRRGLEILAKMQKNPRINLEVMEGDLPEEKEVDNKLLRLCRELNASIITNDYNLNKVAELQGIKVLNVNELTNAVKVIVFPGETMRVNILKPGKEEGQGVGYLEDGTMVVVEQAVNDIGHEVEVMVTSVFQTSAGRMIFTKKIRESSDNSGQAMQRLQEVNFFG
ncbi:MAG: TRAM domain-containing protein [Syntrophomonadaceae bacterium]|nr:TRAM domain-containing protein [Syntrophomonadaceae bacterium]